MQSLPYARKTLVQFDYKEDGRSYVKTSHTVYSRDSSHTWYVMPKVLSQVYMHAWLGSSHMRERAKKDNM